MPVSIPKSTTTPTEKEKLIEKIHEDVNVCRGTLSHSEFRNYITVKLFAMFFTSDNKLFDALSEWEINEERCGKARVIREQLRHKQ